MTNIKKIILITKIRFLVELPAKVEYLARSFIYEWVLQY